MLTGYGGGSMRSKQSKGILNFIARRIPGGRSVRISEDERKLLQDLISRETERIRLFGLAGDSYKKNLERLRKKLF